MKERKMTLTSYSQFPNPNFKINSGEPAILATRSTNPKTELESSIWRAIYINLKALLPKSRLVPAYKANIEKEMS